MIVFRVDANEQVATGHLMRTLSIASACRKRGLTCEFWLAEEKETERIAKAGFPYRILETRWDALEDELPVMKQRLQAQPVDWLVVDSYCATVRYLAELNRMVPVFYVDDFRREHYEVSALLQYIPCRERQKTPEGLHEKDGVQFLTGFLYAPLREEFSRLSFDKPREKSILLSTGGTDPYNMAGRILAYGTRMQELQDYLWHVIVGSMNRNENMLRELAAANPKIILHKNIPDMWRYMQQCEAAVSAGGTTLLELCACGIPTVCFAFADNQLEFAEEMAEHNLLIYAGDVREKDDAPHVICENLVCYTKDAGKRAQSFERMRRLVDGKGAERIAAFLQQYKRDV